MSDYTDVIDLLKSEYVEYSGFDFYNYIFPENESAGELHTDYSMPNAIYLYHDVRDEGTRRRMRRRVMLKDCWENDYKEYVENNPMTLCSGLAYRGRANKLDKAQRMHALAFDLDGVGAGELKNLFLRFGKPAKRIRTLPMPTFLVVSGTGLHVYYVFEKPVDLYPNIKLQMKSLKHDITFRMWDYKGTSKLKQIQYQSINQGFRMVGSINNKYGVPVRAFKIGDKVTVDMLNPYVNKISQVDLTKPFAPSKISRKQAAELYPDWYQRRVIERSKLPKKWDISGKRAKKMGEEHRYDLYNWWLKKSGEILGGHRYFYMMCLAIYACKCDVPKRKLRADLEDVYKELQTVEHENALEPADVKAALEAYDRNLYNFKIEDVEKLTNVRIERNKRNGRKRAVHIKYMNNQRAFKVEMGECTNGGRPEKAEIVADWCRKNPHGTKADCIRETGLSKKTVYKWWFYDVIQEAMQYAEEKRLYEELEKEYKEFKELFDE